MELLVLISTLVHRYDIQPLTPGAKVGAKEASSCDGQLTSAEQLQTAEGFLRKPTEFMIRLKRRDID